MPNPEAEAFSFKCPTPGCGRTYRARPEHAGKLMLCQSCQQKTRIPSASNIQQGNQHTTRPNSTGSEGPSRSGRRGSEQKPPSKLGNTATGETKPQPTRPAPGRGSRSAGNPVSRPESLLNDVPVPRSVDDVPVPRDLDDADPGYEVVGEYDPLPAPPANPDPWIAPEASTTLQTPAKARRKAKQNSLQFLEEIVDSPKLLFIFGSGLALVLIVFGILFAPLALAMRLIGGLFTFAGFIYALRVTFDESPSCGILYLLDCTMLYRIYYTVTRWPDMRHAFFAEVFGVLLIVPWVVLTTEDFMDRVPLNLKNFKGIEQNDPDPDDADEAVDPRNMPFDDAGTPRIRTIILDNSYAGISDIDDLSPCGPIAIYAELQFATISLGRNHRATNFLFSAVYL